MSKVTQLSPAQNLADESCPAIANSAIAHCLSIRARVYKEKLANGERDVIASHYADKAYCNALPPLTGYENIRDFIACIAHAMLIGAILGEHGTKLLYAAQVALSTIRRETAPPKLGSACPPLPPSPPGGMAERPKILDEFAT